MSDSSLRPAGRATRGPIGRAGAEPAARGRVARRSRPGGATRTGADLVALGWCRTPRWWHRRGRRRSGSTWHAGRAWPGSAPRGPWRSGRPAGRPGPRRAPGCPICGASAPGPGQLRVRPGRLPGLAVWRWTSRVLVPGREAHGLRRWGSGPSRATTAASDGVDCSPGHGAGPLASPQACCASSTATSEVEARPGQVRRPRPRGAGAASTRWPCRTSGRSWPTPRSARTTRTTSTFGPSRFEDVTSRARRCARSSSVTCPSTGPRSRTRAKTRSSSTSTPAWSAGRWTSSTRISARRCAASAPPCGSSSGSWTSHVRSGSGTSTSSATPPTARTRLANCSTDSNAGSSGVSAARRDARRVRPAGS